MNSVDAVNTQVLGTAVLHTLALLAAKAVLTVASLRNGAYGGTLTPGLALGAACGFVLTGALMCAFPALGQLPLGASGLLGAAALLGSVTFLSLSMNAPLSALTLIAGFAGQGWGAYVPFALAVGTAWGVKHLWMRARARAAARA